MSASSDDGHEPSSAVSAWASQRRRTASAQQQASTIVASRAGPAATFVPDMCGASEVHAVGWLITGEFGWLVTDTYVACQLATAAAPSSTIEGRADRTRNGGIRRHGSTASSTGSASSTSGCTQTAAPASQPACAVRDRLSASTAYSS